MALFLLFTAREGLNRRPAEKPGYKFRRIMKLHSLNVRGVVLRDLQTIRDCTAYAERNGYMVICAYADRAISGTTDDRPEFQKMIKDSKHSFGRRRQSRLVPQSGARGCSE